MKNMKTIIYMFTISLFLIVSCKSSGSLSGSYSHEIECMGSELDGSVTLKAWGKGRNRFDAIEQAKKDAVNAVLFAGIRNGKSDCDTGPVLNAPNIRANKSDYFNNFFKDGGDYKKFVSSKDESLAKKERAKGRDGEVMFGFIVRVMRSELKKKMITDGILNN
jgi:hypothetical protein